MKNVTGDAGSPKLSRRLEYTKPEADLVHLASPITYISDSGDYVF